MRSHTIDVDLSDWDDNELIEELEARHKPYRREPKKILETLNEFVPGDLLDPIRDYLNQKEITPMTLLEWCKFCNFENTEDYLKRLGIKVN
jgi:hypothetical protein